MIKYEMGDVPVIGTVLKRVGSRFIRREPAMAAGRDSLALVEALTDGESLAIFPEGTFSIDRGLLPFRDGAFFLAAKAGVPVVPAHRDTFDRGAGGAGGRHRAPRRIDLPRRADFRYPAKTQIAWASFSFGKPA